MLALRALASDSFLVLNDTWGINDVNSYWFDSVSIYRQQVVGDWTQPLIDLRQAFTRLTP